MCSDHFNVNSMIQKHIRTLILTLNITQYVELKGIFLKEHPK